MLNSIIKLFLQVLVQPPDEAVVIPAYFKSEFEALLTDEKYTELKQSVYSGVDFNYLLSHSNWSGGASQIFDASGNVIVAELGWKITFLQATNGSVPDPQQLLDSDVDTPVGGETIPESIQIITPPPRLQDYADIGWNGSGDSAIRAVSSCEVTFKFSPRSRGVICGVNSSQKSNDSSSYIDINYGFYGFGRQFRIYENGVDTGVPAEIFIDSDVFKIVVFNTSTKYYVNDVLKRTVERNESYQSFRLDASFYNSGDTITEATIDEFKGIEGSANARVISGGFFSDFMDVLGGSATAKAISSGTFVKGMNGSANARVISGGFFSDFMDVLGGSATAKAISSGTLGLVTPPIILSGSATARAISSGFLDSGEFSGTLLETPPIFQQIGETIDKGQVDSQLWFVTFFADGFEDVVIPVKSITGTLSNNFTSNFLLSIPNGAAWSTKISERSSGTFIITTVDTFSDGKVESKDTNPFNIVDVSSFQGARSFSITVRGTQKLSRISGNVVKVYGQRTSGTSGGKRRIRCDLNKDLLPSDVIVPTVGSSFTVGSITWGKGFIDVTEA